MTKQHREKQHGIVEDDKGQDQPADKKRAQQDNLSPGLKAQKDAALKQPQSPGEPADNE